MIGVEAGVGFAGAVGVGGFSQSGSFFGSGLSGVDVSAFSTDWLIFAFASSGFVGALVSCIAGAAGVGATGDTGLVLCAVGIDGFCSCGLTGGVGTDFGMIGV
ncbi:MAG: hypothetical protein N4A36_04010, partial [Candidatus Gracilibacteria bacterium]|nr:hypothetical protein [Candidatus Gracilibacteria bacterium]